MGITYGKSKRKVAALVPYNKHTSGQKIKLGILKGKASYKIKEGFKMTEEQFLGL